MDDRDIIALYRARDEKAIRETQKKYGRLLHSLAYRVLSDRSDTEECVNDTYHGLWRAIPPAAPERLSAFAAKIVRNLALDRLQYRRAAKRDDSLLVSLHELEEILPNGRDDLDENELGRLISDFLRREDEVGRSIFIRKYWFFDSIAELASRYGYSESKIKSILYRMRGRLAAFLSEKGVSI